jgi:hypothetical protein
MIQYWIAHRGNLEGPNPERENHPKYIQEALNQGFDVEIDVWKIQGGLFLGHDKPQYSTTLEFLKNPKLWCHAKNLEALTFMLEHSIRCFSHDKDDYVIVSDGSIFAYPGKPLNERTVCVMPEWVQYTESELKGCLGICTDYIAYYRQKLNATQRIAMVLSGRTKCYETDLIPELKRYHQENPEHWIDIFTSINSEFEEKYVRDIFPCRYHFEIYNWPERYQNYENIREEYKTQHHLINNFLSHYYNNFKCSQLMKNYCKANLIRYDKVILYRTDIFGSSLPWILKTRIQEKTIYYPEQHIFHPDWINNAIVIGDYDTMQFYFKLYEYIDEYLFKDQYVLHSESLITYHMRKNNYLFKPFNFPYELNPIRR